MTVYAITDTKKGRTGIAPTYLQTTHSWCIQVGYTTRDYCINNLFHDRRKSFYDQH